MSRQPAPPPQVHATLPFVIMISCAAAVGGFLFGFDTAVINGAVDALSGEFVLNDALKGFSVSSALIGCTVGAWSSPASAGLSTSFAKACATARISTVLR